MMSNKEQILQLLDKVPEYKLGYVLAYIQGITTDEEADDAYCERLYQEYLQDKSPDKDEEYSLEECKKEWGIA
jgi:hypothetical protein